MAHVIPVAGVDHVLVAQLRVAAFNLRDYVIGVDFADLVFGLDGNGSLE